jgi:hypothetical protein
MSHHRAAETLGDRAGAAGVQALGASLAPGPSGEKGRSLGSQQSATRAFGSPPDPGWLAERYRDSRLREIQSALGSLAERFTSKERAAGRPVRVFGPRLISYPVNDPPDDWWYMRSNDAPGLSELPPIVVLFRIASEPSNTEPGVIEGHAAWWDDDLVEVLMARLRGAPSL